MIVFTATFFAGRAYAKDGDTLEWPISPARLFQALVASWGHTNGSVREAAAAFLRRLEGLDPPVLKVVHLERVVAPFVYGPRHTEWSDHSSRPVFEKDEPWGARKDLVLLPSAPFGSECTASCAWEYAHAALNDDAEIARALCAGVPYLGTSSSHVVLQVSDAPCVGRFERWQPSRGNRADDRILAVPRHGYFDDLERRFHAFANPKRKVWEPLPEAPAAEVSYVAGEGPPYAGAFSAIMPLLVEPTTGMLQSLALVGALRDALKTDLDFAPFVDDGLYLFPLVAVGYPHATGRCYGIGLAARGKDQLDAIRAKLTTEGVFPVKIGAKALSFRLNRSEGPLPWAASSTRYRGPSRSWATATPMIFPLAPKLRDGMHVEDIVRRSLEICCSGDERALPRLNGMEASMYPRLLGSLPAPAFRRRYPEAGFLIRHVQLRFAASVRGPILIGKGAHRGWGLCVPIREI